MELIGLSGHIHWGIWLILLIAGLNLLASLQQLFELSAFRRRVVDIVPEDVSNRAPQPPAGTRRFVKGLKDLGFERLGEARVKNPRAPQPLKMWIFVDKARTTHVETGMVGMKSAGVVFISTFYDNAVLATAYPRRSWHSDDPDYRTGEFSGSVAEGYRRHLEEVEDFRQRHGKPREMNSMEDFIKYSITYNQRYAGRWATKRIQLMAIKCVASIYAITVTMGAVYAWRWLPLMAGEVALLVLLLASPTIVIELWIMLSRYIDVRGIWDRLFRR